MEKRQAVPGAFKLPAGAKNKEEFERLEQRVCDLENKINALVDSKPEKTKKG